MKDLQNNQALDFAQPDQIRCIFFLLKLLYLLYHGKMLIFPASLRENKIIPQDSNIMF